MMRKDDQRVSGQFKIEIFTILSNYKTQNKDDLRNLKAMKRKRAQSNELG